MSQSVSELADRLVARIRQLGPVAVAFSGGVDSAVVAKAAVLAIGDRAVAVTAVSPSLAAAERADASRLAQEIGIRHVELATGEFQRSEYRGNQPNRCFFCKDTLYTVAADFLKELGAVVQVNGANLDDLGDHRPGMQAAAAHGVSSPLIDEQISKASVRELADFWNLSVADKPASPCLASRIAWGVEVTEERVARVERAEALLKSLTGIRELRVRCEHSELARIEVPLSQLSLLLEPAVREQVTEQFREFGFHRTTLDLSGFRSGSMNDAVTFVSLGSS